MKTVNITDKQVSITTDNAFAEITVYSPSVVRVRIDKQQLQPDFSYAVIAQPQQAKVNITQTSAEISIITDSLKVKISKIPFAITFYTPDGKVISEDETGLTTSWVNESVTTYKKMQEGERFIGLGEKPVTLIVKAMVTPTGTPIRSVTLPSRTLFIPPFRFISGIHHELNYGIFLDNTYQTDFNFGASNDRFSSFGARGGEMNYYFIYHRHIADIITSYTALTGRMKMPPALEPGLPAKPLQLLSRNRGFPHSANPS